MSYITQQLRENVSEPDAFQDSCSSNVTNVYVGKAEATFCLSRPGGTAKPQMSVLQRPILTKKLKKFYSKIKTACCGIEL